MNGDDPHQRDAQHGKTGAAEIDRRSFLRATSAGALAAGVGLGAAGSGAADSHRSFLQTDGAQFVVDGEPIYLSGSNNFWLTDPYHGTQDVADKVFEVFERLGFNFLRTWAFGEGTVEFDGSNIQPEPGVYDESAFKQLDYIVAKAREHGIRLVFALANNWDDYGGMNQYVEWVDGASQHDDFYTNEECKQLYKDFVEAVLTRENTITGIEYRNDPAIGIWELANEPRANNSGTDRQVVHDWMAEMSAFIKDLDSNHLVSTGMEGFYDESGAGGNWLRNGTQGTDYIEDHQIDTIDVATFHMYPDHWSRSPSWGTEWIEEHLTQAEEELGKPSYLGEFGLSLQEGHSMNERNEVYGNWYEALDANDAAGALVWQVDRGTRPENETKAYAIYEEDETTTILTDYARTAREKSAATLAGNAGDGPGAPSNLAVIDRSQASLTVSWDSTTDWGAGGNEYAVYVDGTRDHTVDARTTQTTVTGLSPQTDYEVSVSAVDADGAESATTDAVSAATLPTSTAEFVDPCDDLSMLAPGSDTDALGTDTTNPEYFEAEDGSGDEGRIVRGESGDVAMEYAPGGQLLSAEVLFHWQNSAGGDLELHESTDGGDTWSQLDASVTDFGSYDGDAWHHEKHSAIQFSSGADRLRVVLTGGSEAWSGQVGKVSITYADDSGEGDGTAPTAPADLSSPNQSAGSVDLSWSAATDEGGSGLARYVVSVDGSQETTVSATSTSATVDGLDAATEYEFSVVAVDGAGNESPAATVTATTAEDDGGDEPADSLVVHDFESGAYPGSNVLGNWASAGSFQNDDGEVSGGALRLEYDNGGWFGSQLQTDVSGYERLEFVVRGDSGGEGSHFQVNLGSTSALLSDLTDDSIGTSFSTVAIDLSTVDADLTSVSELRLDFWQGGSGAIEIDEIRFASGSDQDPEDTEAPTTPADLSVTGRTESSLSLSWSASTDADSGVDHYSVRVDGDERTTVAADATTATVEDLEGDTEYEIGVAAVDAAGNASDPATVTATTSTSVDGPTLSVEVTTDGVSSGGTAEAVVTLDSAPAGVSGYDMSVSVADTSVAQITEASYPEGWFNQGTEIASDGSSASLQAIDGGENVQEGAQDVELATITLEAQGTGETDLGVAVETLDADDGSTISASTTGGTLTVGGSDLTPINGVVPQDLDGDGHHMDMNANDEIDADDVVIYFNNYDQPAITDHVEAYDFNDSGEIDFDDIVTLFQEY